MSDARHDRWLLVTRETKQHWHIQCECLRMFDTMSAWMQHHSETEHLGKFTNSERGDTDE